MSCLREGSVHGAGGWLTRPAVACPRRQGSIHPPPDGLALTWVTLPYMSSEVIAGRPAEEADVWSLCVVLHETVSGRHPFASDGAAGVRDRVRRQRLTVGDSGR